VPEYVSHTKGRGKDTSTILTYYKASNSNQAGAHRRGCKISLQKKDFIIAWNYLKEGGI